MSRDADGIIQKKWADSGDHGLGGLDLDELWPVGYSTPGGPFPQRVQFNELLLRLSSYAKELNQGGPFLEYAATIDYAVGAVVTGSDGSQYKAIVANGPSSSVVNPVGNPATWIVTGAVLNIFDSSGTWNKKAGLKSVIAIAIGGGPGGGGVDGQGGGTSAAATGGSGAGTGIKQVLAGNLGSSETVTVGAKGTGGVAGDNDGNDGGDSSFGAHCQGWGGDGGLGMLGAASGGESGGIGGLGTGDLVLRGDWSHGTTVSGTTPLRDGDSGASVLGGAVRGRTGNADGIDADTPGAGGGGAGCGAVATNYKGGDGEDGIVIVIEFY